VLIFTNSPQNLFISGAFKDGRKDVNYFVATLSTLRFDQNFHLSTFSTSKVTENKTNKQINKQKITFERIQSKVMFDQI